MFELGNYWMFLVVLAAAYLIVTRHAQNTIGGKNRMKSLQAELKEVQKRMMDASKSKREEEVNKAIEENWKLTWELMGIQTKMMFIILGVLFGLMYVFPYLEPGLADDVHLPLYDDGLASHCDAAANDGISSNCYVLPNNATGAWTISALLKSEGNETLAKNATAVYSNGQGKPEDVWLQAMSQSGFIDGLLGKTPYTLNISTDRQNYTGGQMVKISAFSIPATKNGAKLEAQIDSGSRFYIDLPFTIPLLNIQRIIGSYGVFIFIVFLLGLVYSAATAAHAKATGKK